MSSSLSLEEISKGRTLIEVLLAPKSNCQGCQGRGILFVRIPIPQNIITPQHLQSTMVRPAICGCAKFFGNRELNEEAIEALNTQIEKSNATIKEGVDARP